MQIVASLAAVLGMAAFAQAHMEMTNPPPLRSSKNKFSTNVDYEMKSPLSPDGSNFPCRGSIGLVGTDQGKAVADWAAGSQQSLTVDGSAFHGGGSCQASLSYDKGKTWTVIHSYLGDCPSGAGPTSYDFTVPADAAAGEAVFAWTWFNKIGNREMYMNCAVVNIQAGKSKKRRGVAMSSRPNMFVANVGNGCGTSEGKDLQFPDPGADVTTKGSNFGPPTGKCATGGGSNPAPQQPSSSSSSAAASVPAASSSSVAASSAPSPTGTQKPTPSIPGGVFATVSETSSGAVAPSASASTPAAQPTTIQTSIRPSSGAPVATNSTPAATGSAPAATNSVPAATGSTSAATPAPTGGSGSTGYEAGAACDELGSWNCIDGKQFQRCASGNMWSTPMGLAAGTACQPGVAKDIVFV